MLRKEPYNENYILHLKREKVIKYRSFELKKMKLFFNYICKIVHFT